MLRTGVGDGARTDRALLDLSDDALEVAALAEDGRGLVQVPVPVGVVVGLKRCTEARATIWRRVDVRGGGGGRRLASLGGCLSVLAHGILYRSFFRFGRGAIDSARARIRLANSTAWL